MTSPPRALARTTAASALLILSALAAAGCSDPPPENFIAPDGILWTSDGVITEGEYQASKIVSDNFQLYWNCDGSYVYMAMKGTSPYSSGYVAIGFLDEDWIPEWKKQHTDMIIGFYANGQAYATDAWCEESIVPHPADDKNNVEKVSGSVSGNTTTIEFRRKLNTGDSKDQKLEMGVNQIMWAVGFSPTDSGAHPGDGRGYSEIDLTSTYLEC